MYYRALCKVTVILVRFVFFKKNSYFLNRFSKNPQLSFFTKIRPVGVEFFHAERRADGRTDGRTDL